MEVPWFALSPSPFSMVFYGVLVIWGARQFLKINSYKRWKVLNAFLEAFFVVGFVVLIGDLMWVVACLLRFGMFYPDSLLQLLFCLGRDSAGILFCYFMVGNYLKNGVLNYKAAVKIWLLNILFLFFWFSFSPSPAYTDWTYAIRYGYSFATILTAFLISHVLGRILIGLAYYKMWSHDYS